MTQTISPFLQAVYDRTEQALTSGDLQPLQTKQETVEDHGLPFTIRWAAALAKKDAAKTEAKPIMPGGPRGSDFNPFLKPEAALTLAPLGDAHNIILNKFPVCHHHLVLARREFAEQLTPLERSDFDLWATILADEGGLGFVNGGAAGGASQRHKHTQWLPTEPDNPSLTYLIDGLPADAAPGTQLRHPRLAFAHCFTRVLAGRGADAQASASSMQNAYQAGLQTLGLTTDVDGLLPAHNVLVQDGWFLMVARRQEHFQDISFNALSFAGVLYVREREQIDALRAAGPLKALAEVSMPG